jgi:hypothetical protein
MGLVGQTLGSVSASLAKVDGDCKSSSTTGDMDRGTSGKIQTTLLEDPATGVPGPASDRIVDDSRPEENEDEDRS